MEYETASTMTESSTTETSLSATTTKSRASIPSFFLVVVPLLGVLVLVHIEQMLAYNHHHHRSMRTTVDNQASICTTAAAVVSNDDVLGTTRKYQEHFNNNNKNYLVKNFTFDYKSCVNNTTPLNWCPDNETQTPRYLGRDVWPPKMIQHYTHEGYEACLANKVVVFIGDSRVRFQYLALIDFLKKKAFMKCQDYDHLNNETEDKSCFLINGPPDPTNWNEWYKQSTLELNDNFDNEALSGKVVETNLCDCFREKKFQVKTTYENRYWYRRSRFGVTKLIYLQSFENSVRIDKDFPPFSDPGPNKARCQVAECGKGNRTNGFRGTVREALWEILPKLNATHAFVNLGWTEKLKQLSAICCVMETFQRSHPDISTFLLSHPHRRNKKVSTFYPRRLECNCEVVDRTTMSTTVPDSWYNLEDMVHPLSILNEEFNHQTIEKICPIKNA